jgi:hypothetical protein
MTAILLLTLITGQQIEIESPIEGCKAAVAQFQAGASSYVELNGAHVKIENMTCEVKA